MHANWARVLSLASNRKRQRGDGDGRSGDRDGQSVRGLIIGTIKERFPDHAFIGEESSFTGPGGPTKWPARALRHPDVDHRPARWHDQLCSRLPARDRLDWPCGRQEIGPRRRLQSS